MPNWNLTRQCRRRPSSTHEQLKKTAPDKPFFVYYVPGGTHGAASSDAELDQKIGAVCICSTRLGQAAGDHFAHQKRLGIMA